jgi:hypothetical protein
MCMNQYLDIGRERSDFDFLMQKIDSNEEEVKAICLLIGERSWNAFARSSLIKLDLRRIILVIRFKAQIIYLTRLSSIRIQVGLEE